MTCNAMKGSGMITKEELERAIRDLEELRIKPCDPYTVVRFTDRALAVLRRLTNDTTDTR